MEFGGAKASTFTVKSPNSITATAPAGTGTVDATVTTPGGTSARSSADRFSYLSAPIVTTGSTSLITASSATLTATVNPDGQAVSVCQIEYGSSDSYGSRVPCTPNPGSGEAAVSVSAAISGLTANTTYHFRVVATNVGGTAYGSDQTLKTLPSAPTVITEPASSVTQTSVEFNASVNPSGGTVSACYFEYGTTEAYGSSVSCTPLPGSGESPVAVSVPLGLLSLSESTTYHFRVVATNAGGTSYGSDQALTTLSTTASGASGEASTPAEAVDGPLSATSSDGEGAVTVGQYGSSNPAETQPFMSSGDYIDAYVSPGNTFTSLQLTDCELNGGTTLYWWNPQANAGTGEWQVVSDQTAPSGSPPCITVTITETTEPSLKQLTGTVFAVEPKAKPEVTKQPASQTVTAGSPASFTALASGNPKPSVQWQVSTNGGSSWSNDLTDAGNTTDTLTISSATVGENGYEYRAVFSNQVQSGVASKAATLTVHSPPLITSNPANQTVTAGSPASFTALASGSPAPLVQWQVSTNGGSSWSNDTTDSGNSTTALTISGTTVGENGYEYRAVFSNEIQSGVASKAATLTVNAPLIKPTVTKVEPGSGPTAGGTAVTVTGTEFSGASAVKFGSTAATSFKVTSATSISATAPAGTGTVDVTVTTPGGTSATSPADKFSYTSSTVLLQFTNWILSGKITPKKLGEAITLPKGSTFTGSGELNPQTGAGSLTGKVTVPAFAQTLKLFGFVPTQFGLTITQSGALEGTLVKSKTISGDETLTLPLKVNLGMTAVGILGLNVPTNCKTTQPISLTLVENLTEQALRTTGWSFTGTTTIASIKCEGGILGSLFGEVLSPILSGPEAAYSIGVVP